MSRVMAAWQAVLRQAADSDFDEQQHALFQIGLVLERHNLAGQQQSAHLYEENLPRELLRLTLSLDRQRETVEYLAAMAVKHRRQADSFLYALGRAQPAAMIVPLLTLIQDNGTALPAAAAYQAVTALNNALNQAGDDDTVQSALAHHDPRPQLIAWSEHSDDDLAARAARVLAKLPA